SVTADRRGPRRLVVVAATLLPGGHGRVPHHPRVLALVPPPDGVVGVDTETVRPRAIDVRLPRVLLPRGLVHAVLPGEGDGRAALHHVFLVGALGLERGRLGDLLVLARVPRERVEPCDRKPRFGFRLHVLTLEDPAAGVDRPCRRAHRGPLLTGWVWWGPQRQVRRW